MTWALWARKSFRDLPTNSRTRPGSSRKCGGLPTLASFQGGVRKLQVTDVQCWKNPKSSCKLADRGQATTGVFGPIQAGRWNRIRRWIRIRTRRKVWLWHRWTWICWLHNQNPQSRCHKNCWPFASVHCHFDNINQPTNQLQPTHSNLDYWLLTLDYVVHGYGTTWF